MSDARGNKTTYEYDGFDRLKRTRFPRPTSVGTSSATDYEELTWSNAGANNLGRFQFTGQMWLEEAGLYHFKARAYHPALGRFMQADPIGYGDGMNMYAYVGNDPVNARDPSGMVATGKDGDHTKPPPPPVEPCGSRLPGWTAFNCTSVGGRSGAPPDIIGNTGPFGGFEFGVGAVPTTVGFRPGTSAAVDYGDEIVVTATRSVWYVDFGSGMNSFYSPARDFLRLHASASGQSGNGGRGKKKEKEEFEPPPVEIPMNPRICIEDPDGLQPMRCSHVRPAGCLETGECIQGTHEECHLQSINGQPVHCVSYLTNEIIWRQ